MLKRFVIKKNEKGALLRNGDFERILSAGRHYFFDRLGQLAVQVWNIDTPMHDLATVDYLAEHDPQEVEEHFVCMALNEDQVGLRFENDVLVEVLPPATRLVLWKGFRKQRLEAVDLTQEYTIKPELVRHLVQTAPRGRLVNGLQGVLVRVSGKFYPGKNREEEI